MCQGDRREYGDGVVTLGKLSLSATRYTSWQFLTDRATSYFAGFPSFFILYMHICNDRLHSESMFLYQFSHIKNSLIQASVNVDRTTSHSMFSKTANF